MKRIVLVEDRPWVVETSVKELMDKEVQFAATLFYPNNQLYREKQDELIDKFKENTGIEVIQIKSLEDFVYQMDEFFSDKKNIFLVDYDLKGDMRADDFDDRVNIRYAKNKNVEGSDSRIWFYTSGGAEVKNALAKAFPNNVIDTPYKRDGDLHWDIDEVYKLIEE